ncbi:uncharacterized protein LOC109863187 [Pseudomyrmex gracilis]|uniref:uncharacterized protein LOC109863187 n=1 Tax=Pseudomyrmex gracilis TaxID=219809 RepID=UPI000995C34A|nr:uncharacterized protein LOC109863187 [Pseudomyrmex gracilis]
MGLLRLTLAPTKTEAVIFRPPRCRKKRPVTVWVGPTQVATQPHMKYLGLQVDDRWKFRAHFDYVARKTHKVTWALSRLLPNLGGPRQSVRKLYANVVHSVVMYGAPVWHREVGMGRTAAPIASVQRLVGGRVARAYRTAALESVRLLARIPPVDLLAGAYAEAYEARKAELGRARATGRDLNPEEVGRARSEAHDRMVLRWQHRIEDPRLQGWRVREAVEPVLKDWASRPYL